jgi:hypothetical protein
MVDVAELPATDASFIAGVLPGAKYRNDEEVYAPYQYKDPVHVALRKVMITKFERAMDRAFRAPAHASLLTHYGITGATVEGSTAARHQQPHLHPGSDGFDARRGLGDIDLNIRGNNNYFWLKNFVGDHDHLMRRRFIREARNGLDRLLQDAANEACMKLTPITQSDLPSDWAGCFDISKLKFYHLEQRFSTEQIQGIIKDADRYHLNRDDIDALRTAETCRVALFIDYKDIFPFPLLPCFEMGKNQPLLPQYEYQSTCGVMTLDVRDVAAQKVLGLFHPERQLKYTDAWDLAELVNCGALKPEDPIFRKMILANMAVLQPVGYGIEEIDLDALRPDIIKAEQIAETMNDWISENAQISPAGALDIMGTVYQLVGTALGKWDEKDKKYVLDLKENEIAFLNQMRVTDPEARRFEPELLMQDLIEDLRRKCAESDASHPENAALWQTNYEAHYLKNNLEHHTGAMLVCNNLDRRVGQQAPANGRFSLCDL